MTEPGELLADRRWRRRRSLYLLWALVPTLGFISLLYTGFRARRSEWILPGLLYGAVLVVLLVWGAAAEAGWPALVVWLVTGLHVLLTRPAWLQFAAASEARGDAWYGKAARRSGVAAAPAPSPALAVPGPGPDVLAEIDRLDPMSAYVDPAVAPPAAGTAPVDLNAATADQLAAVLGAGAIGEVFARRIVEERDRIGGFGSVDQAAAAVDLEPHLHARLAQSSFVPGHQPPPPTPGTRVS